MWESTHASCTPHFSISRCKAGCGHIVCTYMLTWTHMAWARDGGSLIPVRHIAKFKGLLTKG